MAHKYEFIDDRTLKFEHRGHEYTALYCKNNYDDCEYILVKSAALKSTLKCTLCKKQDIASILNSLKAQIDKVLKVGNYSDEFRAKQRLRTAKQATSKT